MELLTITVVNFVLFCCNITTVMVNNSTNTTKQKKVYNSDGQQFHQYNKTKESLQQ
jgi:ribosome-associated protein YbcJ (S4-like RNA binding protein)